MTGPRIIHVMGPEISQDFGSLKQIVRMCIEVKKGEVDFTGDSFKVVPIESFADLQEKLKVAEEFIINLTGEEDGTIKYPAIEALKKIRGEG